jgi:hypothetical protein
VPCLLPPTHAAPACRLRGSAAKGRPPFSAGSEQAAQHTLPLAGLRENGEEEEPVAAANTAARPQLPSRGRNTIEDDAFFESLPEVRDAPGQSF